MSDRSKEVEIKQYTISELNTMSVSKGDLFKSLDCTFDYALPQDWLDRFASYCNLHQMFDAVDNAYHLILSTTVWAYPPNVSFGGLPVFACKDVELAYHEFCIKEK